MLNTDQPNNKTARLAGLLYLIVVITSLFSLVYVPAGLGLRGNALQIVRSLHEDETLYRLGMMASVLCYTAFFLLPLVLYRLLSGYGRYAGALMVTFALLSVPIALSNLRHQFEVLSLLNDANLLHIYSPRQLSAKIVLALDQYASGLLVSKLFWGLWLAPFGYLVFKSGVLPKFLGILLMFGCVAYLVDLGGVVLVANYKHSFMGNYASMPAAVGEIAIGLWLLIMGAQRQSQRRPIEPQPVNTLTAFPPRMTEPLKPR
ncbi:DUF4386 domain-containing protein [Massilia sp. CF038]|uniref:DUF4386 domain-containing protein n=1 Tax=Massilia sp. CF038 TaxID=1881045 RepID=UPI000921A6EC|nr:DUF4386 domain-containing protein [Massilia sp. CF038]SHH02836.1 protein of unknown function [Massilia sp. CF038]